MASMIHSDSRAMKTVTMVSQMKHLDRTGQDMHPGEATRRCELELLCV